MSSMFKTATYSDMFTTIEKSSTSLANDIDESSWQYKIKKIRHQLGMSQKEFAKYCNIGYSTLCKYESGLFNISLRNQNKLCTKLNLKLFDLGND